ncbi:MAG: UvrD-helicase domain-containing protein [Spirochaetaceae bacterium]|nr:UvrD-helicase domain-containing protein [Spirochaetaceae bacterium]
MKLVADIHLHSHYSRATSRDLTLEHLWKWAQIKGVQVVATGDIAHPGWLAELRDKLEPAEAGLFRLKPEHAAALADQVPAACRGTVRFLVGGEISNIYKKYDRTRKVHNIVFAPSFDATARLQEELEKIGNIRSDGRPILGLDSRDLLEIVLAVDDRCHLIPAHIWTPWFSILGSRSGFDSVQECYADLTPHIFAVETGLSSDPPMNWRVSWLDDYTLISSSDAHSPPKLAREATCFDTELSYDALFDALRGGARRGYRGTVEFFPEEGKYHMDGHRKCGVCWEPAATRAHGGRCSACGKPVTVGVYHRMEELADRPRGARPACAGPFASLIPLPEALSEVLGVGANSKRVQREYHRLVERLGPELAILREVPLKEIDAAGGAVLAEGIRRMRAGEVRAQGGYDGEYGVIRLFDGEADRSSVVQLGMFDQPPASREVHSAPNSPATTAPPAPEPPAPDPPSAAAAAVAEGPPGRQRQPSGAGRALTPEATAAPESASAPKLPTLPVQHAYQPNRARERPPATRPSAPTGPRPAPAPLPAAGPRAARDLPTAPKSPAAADPPTPEPSAPRLPAPRVLPPALDSPSESTPTAAEPPAARHSRATSQPAAAASEPHPWLAGLNPAQRAAATHTTGPLAIIAGPGTGKTRTLTVRIAHLVRALAADPASILVLTFTHKAADELRERLGELLPARAAARIGAGTFHQLGAHLLEEFGDAAGVPRPFVIFDEADRTVLLKQCFPSLSARQARDALAAISADKNGLPPTSDGPRGYTADARSPSTRPDPPPPAPADASPRTAAASQACPPPAPPATPGLPSLPDVATLRTRYDSALAAAGALDLDDLVVRTARLLDSDAAVRRTLQQRYRWISVDEYQDVNAAQYRLLRLLAGGGANLCVIGDPDQAIYGFRGADRRFFLSFGADFPAAETLRLDRNYRSAQTILTAAGQVIAGNPGHQATRLIAAPDVQSPNDAGDREHPGTGIPRARRLSHLEAPSPSDTGDHERLRTGGSHATRLSHSAAQVKLDVYRAPTDRAEAEYVVHQVERLIGGTSYFSLDSGRVEDDAVAEARSFADFAVLYRLNAQARLLEEAFDRSGIPYQTAGATPLAEQAPVREILALLWLSEAPASPLHWRRVLLAGASAAAAAPAAHGSTHGRPTAALHLVRKLAADRRAPVAERARAAAEGWAALRGRRYDDAEAERIARLQTRAAAAHAGMREFLTAAALQSETDRYDGRADRVALMSLHAAKGLEFPVVFIAGCEQGLLPYRPPNRAADPAEERRLFYVGMTRARRRLILTHAARRVLFGERLENPISHFVTDIETALRETGRPPHPPRRPTAEDLQLPLF